MFLNKHHESSLPALSGWALNISPSVVTYNVRIWQNFANTSHNTRKVFHSPDYLSLVHFIWLSSQIGDGLTKQINKDPFLSPTWTFFMLKKKKVKFCTYNAASSSHAISLKVVKELLGAHVTV